MIRHIIAILMVASLLCGCEKPLMLEEEGAEDVAAAEGNLKVCMRLSRFLFPVLCVG